jgi:hypothetical protein
MFRHVLLSLVVVAMFTQSLCAISREELSREALIGRYKDWKKFAIYTPAPQYPVEAAARHIRGSGIFIIRVHVKTGLVVSAWASQSIGSPLLDSAAFRSGASSPACSRRLVSSLLSFTIHSVRKTRF